MFLAKLKTATVLLVALGLGTGGLCYLTRAGAAGTPQVGRKPTADEEKARKPDEDARARERGLLEELEKARKEAVMQRDRAEAERKRAEEAMRALKEQLAKAQEAETRARQQAERALYADRVRQAQQGLDSKPEERKRLAELQAKVRERFKEERKALAERMKQLEAEERETLAKLDAERGEFLRRQNARAEGKPPQGGDKLDRILERLDRIERRLEKLEQGGRK